MHYHIPVRSGNRKPARNVFHTRRIKGAVIPVRRKNRSLKGMIWEQYGKRHSREWVLRLAHCEGGHAIECPVLSNHKLRYPAINDMLSYGRFQLRHNGFLGVSVADKEAQHLTTPCSYIVIIPTMFVFCNIEYNCCIETRGGDGDL